MRPAGVGACVKLGESVRPRARKGRGLASRALTRRLSVVGNPELVAGLVREVEVTARRDGEVRAVGVALDRVDRAREIGGALHTRRRDAVERRIDRLPHLRLPVTPSVVSRVDCACTRRHLGLTRAKRDDAVWVARQLGRQRHALPRVAAVPCVQEDRWLADDPSFACARASGEVARASVSGRRRRRGGKLMRSWGLRHTPSMNDTFVKR